VVDAPDFPAAWKAPATKGRDFLNELKKEAEIDWTFLSPSTMIAPGERTGKFRLGGDELLIDSKGQSHIIQEDYALGMIDELEQPRHSRSRFTIGY